MAKNLYNKVLWNSATGDQLTAGTGITTGTNTLFQSSTERKGNMVKTTILVRLNGLNSGNANDDIIGVNAAANCHIGQYIKDKMGTLFAGSVTCLVLPTGGNADIDLNSATVATGVEDTLVTSLTGYTQMLNAGAHTLASVKPITTFPSADAYLYLSCGTLLDATYTAGILLIEMYGWV